jgi:uncharacterized protein (TIGR02145 family)
MFKNQKELTEFLSLFVDTIGPLYGRGALSKPYRVSHNGIDYVGAGDTFMHIIIPEGVLPFTINDYNSFQQIAKLLDTIEAFPIMDVSTDVFQKKMDGLSIASRINGVGFHRRLISKLFLASTTLDIAIWKHLNCLPDKFNVFSNDACKVIIMPYASENELTLEDDIRIADITPFDTNTIEALTPEQASALASSKKSIHFPNLKTLTKEVALRLKNHVAFDIDKGNYSNRVLADNDYNYDSVIHFGPHLIIEDEVLQCFNECYSDLLFDDVKSQQKYEMSKQLRFKYIILKRLDEVLCTAPKLDIVFNANTAETDIHETWHIVNDQNTSDIGPNSLNLNVLDKTGFLTDLFSRMERLDRQHKKQNLFSYRSIWTINRETKEFLNQRKENVISFWNCENLRTKHFANGDPILFAETDEDWKNAVEKNIPAYCYVENQASNEHRGLLYNHHVLTDSRGIAPEGWRIARLNDWQLLIDSYGGVENAAHVLCSNNQWMNGRNGANAVGFNLIPTGQRMPDGDYDNVLAYPDDDEGDMDQYCYSSFWALNNEDAEVSVQVYLSSDPDDSIRFCKVNKGSGCCIRLIKA